MNDPLLFTIGHSNRPLTALLELLAAHHIEWVADVRAVPRSRRHPQFDRDALATRLARAGIGYTHIPSLGGMRKGAADSPHTALKEPAFRAYAEHMSGAEFERGASKLLALAARCRAVAMCAEANPAECHRSLMADGLLLRGAGVAHIVDAAVPRAHVMDPRACLVRGRLIYSAAQESLGL